MSWKSLSGMLVGFLTIFTLGFLIDSWFYKESVFPLWNYWSFFFQNNIAVPTTGFGEEPWWYYLTEILEKSVAPIGVFLLFVLVWNVYYRRAKFEIWGILFFILLHILISHKELRFLFPLNYLMPILIADFVGVNLERIKLYLLKWWFKGVFYLMLFVNFGLLIFVMFSPSDSYIDLYAKVYDEAKSYESTTVYYKDDNLYFRVLDIYFYSPKNVSFQKYEFINEIPVSTADNLSVILYVQREAAVNTDSLGVLLAKKYPDWMNAVNVKNWMYESNYWQVYKK